MTVPRKPLRQKNGLFLFCFICPECKQPIPRYFNGKEFEPEICYRCGQALDWSSEVEDEMEESKE